ncbi:hypothetical protein VA7868_00688 [Vibrio aerogenes CECT 7868]|uniref:Flagellar basal-body protein n=1 Tax=Vibrio aerogenes CECT 7868 TaxID=1216006 RepID=A0A1M5WDX7_9VIBR|nr:flagellar assembly protein FlgT [Vibrio aerogenes]SHH85433.1 hypothetical protein VA7868_00688 [Vibrio aerogenes CECT 7868]
MKKFLTIFILILTVMAEAPSAMAAWYEVTGTSYVVSSQKKASVQALEDAIYQAVSFSGADIGSISPLFPLLDSDKSEFQFTNHEIRYILVEKREIKNNVMYVHAKIDIYPSATTCHMNEYKKTFLISNIDLESPQQAVMGQIYDLGDDFARVIDKQLSQESHSFVSVGTTNYVIDKNHPSRIKMIAEDKGAQYIIGGKITDVTATISSSAGKEVINREFALEMHIFDGKTGNEVYKQNYREIAQWPFPKTSQIDTRSARFWASAYGEMLLRLSRKIMLDLESEFSCKITLPEVVAKFGNKITMNLGRLHGVKTGDKLQLWHTGSFIDQHGIPRNKVTKSNITLTVSRIYEKEAELTIDQDELADSIQIGDVMQKQN